MDLFFRVFDIPTQTNSLEQTSTNEPFCHRAVIEKGTSHREIPLFPTRAEFFFSFKEIVHLMKENDRGGCTDKETSKEPYNDPQYNVIRELLDSSGNEETEREGQKAQPDCGEQNVFSLNCIHLTKTKKMNMSSSTIAPLSSYPLQKIPVDNARRSSITFIPPILLLFPLIFFSLLVLGLMRSRA